VKIAKWSAGEQWDTERDGAREVSEEVITRSRMWLWLWVGKVTCCLRLKEERRERNWDVRESVSLSMCILKSPVMRNSWGVPVAYGVVALKQKQRQKQTQKNSKLVQTFPKEGNNICPGKVVIVCWFSDQTSVYAYVNGQRSPEVINLKKLTHI